MQEIWKDIPGYEGIYQASSFGRIKSVPHMIKANINGGRRITEERFKALHKGWHGYLWVSLCKGGKAKTQSVHRVIANTFLENKNNYPDVNHKDGNKLNNNVDNLEWCTTKQNQIHAAVNGLLGNSKKVRCVETNKIYQSSGEAERDCGICGRNIRSACSGRYKTAGGYHWEWV